MSLTSLVRSTSTPSIGEEIFPNEVNSLPYFHPDITSMQQVFSVVKQYVNDDGYFLLRKSFSKPGTLTVSVLHGRGVKHFSIAKEKGEYFLKDRLFRTIKDLVVYYKTNDVPNVEGITNVRLETPIARSDAQYLQQNGEVDSLSQSVLPFQREQKNSSSRAATLDLAKRSLVIDKRSPGLLASQRAGKCSSMEDDLEKGRKVRSNSLGKTMNEKGEYHSVLVNVKQSSDGLHPNDPSVMLSSDAQWQPPSAYMPPSPNLNARRQQMNLPPPPPRTTDASPYYSTVRNTYEEMAPNLIKVLRDVEYDEGERCVCGLLIDEAELVMGWTMHLSTEPESEGKLFFMGPDGETAWNLPLQVSINLSMEQQEKIQSLLQRHT